MAQKVWIIGGSSGIGLELTKRYLETNNDVILSARSATTLKHLQELVLLYPDTLKLLDIDVANSQSVKDGVALAWSMHDGIDLCIYNAGIYESMKMDEWNLEHFEAMNQINYMGGVRIVTGLAPLFEAQKNGHFVFNLSISSYLGLPYGGGYSAPKAALLNFCESIQPELMLKSIKVQVINHGFVKTRLTAKNSFEMPQLLEPGEAALKIFNAIENKPYGFEIRFPFLMTSFLNVLRMLPYRISLALTKKAL
jgi:short-subunit dehydrogenase